MMFGAAFKLGAGPALPAGGVRMKSRGEPSPFHRVKRRRSAPGSAGSSSAGNRGVSWRRSVLLNEPHAEQRSAAEPRDGVAAGRPRQFFGRFPTAARQKSLVLDATPVPTGKLCEPKRI